jgi:tetratricopeptide (TPR) repeat protein
LAFEDLQWADSGLLDFIGYLLDWSTDSPIFVLSLARPELRERRPQWTPLALPPLDQPSIAQILEGLAPGLPPDVVAAIGRRSDGIPLYAVEMVRMLRDRGALVLDGDRYIVTGDIDSLAVPETLQALAASRLDTLSGPERSLLQDASVLGRSFSAAGVAAISERPLSEAQEVLDALVAKQVLGRDDDPRSPRRSEYVFLQALLQNVTYAMLARQGRKRRHLAAARYLERTPESSEIAEVLAAHYLEAIRADPEADDVAELRRLARQRLVDAGQAAASLSLGREAQRYFEQAAALTDDTLELARLAEWSGAALVQSGDAPAAEPLLRRAIELYEQTGLSLGGSATIRLARVLRHAGRMEEVRRLLDPFRDASAADRIVRAEALAELAVTHVFAGALAEAGPLFDEALTTLEQEQVWPALADALVGHAVYFVRAHRLRECEAVLRAAVALAEERDLPSVVLRARYNLTGLALWHDRLEDAVAEADAALALARQRGDRTWIGPLRQNAANALCVLGRWDEAFQAVGDLLTGDQDTFRVFAADVAAQIAAARGDDETFATCLALAVARRDADHVDERASAVAVMARDALAHGRAREALALIQPMLEEAGALVVESVEELHALGIDAALSLDDDGVLLELSNFVTELPPARATPLLLAGRARIHAEQAQRRGEPAAAWVCEDEALAALRQVGARPLMAQVLIERGRRHDDPAALAEARDIYIDLRAERWLSALDLSVESPAA